MTDELRCVSQGFDRTVMKYEKYDVNGYRFHTENHQKTRPNAKTINTGVFTRGSRGVDGANYVDYYGRLEKVYELTFNRTNIELKLVVFQCHWFDPDTGPHGGMRSDPSIGLVEVKTSTTYSGADVFIVAHQAKQVYYLPYPCQKEGLKGWEVVFRVSPHGKLPMPSADDYNNINPKTYEGIFYQEQEDFGDFGLQTSSLEDLESDAHTRGEQVVNLKDIDILSKFQADNAKDDEPPPCDDQPTYINRDSDIDSENENELNYETDDSR